MSLRRALLLSIASELTSTATMRCQACDSALVPLFVPSKATPPGGRHIRCRPSPSQQLERGIIMARVRAELLVTVPNTRDRPGGARRCRGRGQPDLDSEVLSPSSTKIWQATSTKWVQKPGLRTFRIYNLVEKHIFVHCQSPGVTA